MSPTSISRSHVSVDSPLLGTYECEIEVGLTKVANGKKKADPPLRFANRHVFGQTRKWLTYQHPQLIKWSSWSILREYVQGNDCVCQHWELCPRHKVVAVSPAILTARTQTKSRNYDVFSSLNSLKAPWSSEDQSWIEGTQKIFFWISWKPTKTCFSKK